MSNTLEEKRRLWQQHIEHWKQSGLTQKVFCQKHQLNIHQFAYWHRRFKPPKPNMPNESSSANDTAFVPVNLSTTTMPTSSPSLALSNGIRIHGIHQLSPEYLGALVKTLV